jgi:hypothetical protein
MNGQALAAHPQMAYGWMTEPPTVWHSHLIGDESPQIQSDAAVVVVVVVLVVIDGGRQSILPNRFRPF